MLERTAVCANVKCTRADMYEVGSDVNVESIIDIEGAI